MNTFRLLLLIALYNLSAFGMEPSAATFTECMYLPVGNEKSPLSYSLKILIPKTFKHSFKKNIPGMFVTHEFIPNSSPSFEQWNEIITTQKIYNVGCSLKEYMEKTQRSLASFNFNAKIIQNNIRCNRDYQEGILMLKSHDRIHDRPELLYMHYFSNGQGIAGFQYTIALISLTEQQAIEKIQKFEKERALMEVCFSDKIDTELLARMMERAAALGSKK